MTPPPVHPIPDPLVELIARRFRLLAEPMRLRLLDRLRRGETTVSALAEAVAASEQNVSKHLSLMAAAGLLARRKEGACVYYRIADEEALVVSAQVEVLLEHQLRSLAALVEHPVTPQSRSVS